MFLHIMFYVIQKVPMLNIFKKAEINVSVFSVGMLEAV